jgi:hypothetical protein
METMRLKALVEPVQTFETHPLTGELVLDLARERGRAVVRIARC